MGQFATKEEELRYLNQKGYLNEGVEMTPEELEQRIKVLEAEELREQFKTKVSMVHKGRLLPKGFLSFRVSINKNGTTYSNQVVLDCREGFNDAVKNGAFDRLIQSLIKKYNLVIMKNGTDLTMGKLDND